LHPESLPDEKLQLLPARMMVNKRPVLIYHTRSAQVRVIVSISDIHLREHRSMYSYRTVPEHRSMLQLRTS
ncbi:cyclic diguanylate phosphodiesterase (EAL) domain-containing protein, partial [Klebsiella pneumoniae RYC492]